MRTLLVEKHEHQALDVQAALTKSGFAVDLSSTLEDASAAIDCANYNILLLDLTLPDGDGLSWLRQIRRRGLSVPTMVMSEKNDPLKRIEVYNGGADDFLAKPISIDELIARMRAILRRPQTMSENIFSLGSLTIDTVGRQAMINNSPLNIARRELCILEVLANRAGRVVTRAALEESIYNFTDEVSSNALEVGVYRLRTLLSKAHADVQIRTARGIGYVLELKGANAD